MNLTTEPAGNRLAGVLRARGLLPGCHGGILAVAIKSLHLLLLLLGDALPDGPQPRLLWSGATARPRDTSTG